MKDKALDILLGVMCAVAVLMVLLAMFLVTTNENRIHSSCEEIEQRRNGSTYVPMPKECEKGKWHEES